LGKYWGRKTKKEQGGVIGYLNIGFLCQPLYYPGRITAFFIMFNGYGGE